MHLDAGYFGCSAETAHRERDVTVLLTQEDTPGLRRKGSGDSSSYGRGSSVGRHCSFVRLGRTPTSWPVRKLG
jgi:hypothetical protein